MNTDKALEGRGDLTEKEYLKKLEGIMASETAAEEQSLSEFMDMKYQMALDKFLENNPDKSEKDFQDSIRRLSLESGGKVIKFSDYKDPIKKVKEIDLAGLFTPGKTLASLTEDERDVVNKLLKMTLGKSSE
jgi:hypothetical protein|tara:strand:+ start:3003 stop:3398 length:396 start_codon:yes stop_codon:yes gene_type:complete